MLDPGLVFLTVVVPRLAGLLQADEAGAEAAGEEDEDLMVDLSLKKKKKKKKVSVLACLT
jgi:hypothetical protein